MVGPSAAATLEEHRFDTYVMAVSGIDPVHGCTEWNVDDAVVKRVALKVSSRCIVAADATKFGFTAFARVCAIDAVSTVVTDASLGEEDRQRLAAARVTVLIAQ